MLCFKCGDKLKFYDTTDESETFLVSPGNGIHNFTTKPNENLIAFSEQGLHPTIYIYDFITRQIVHELKGNFI